MNKTTKVLTVAIGVLGALAASPAVQQAVASQVVAHPILAQVSTAVLLLASLLHNPKN